MIWVLLWFLSAALLAAGVGRMLSNRDRDLCFAEDGPGRATATASDAACGATPESTDLHRALLRLHMHDPRLAKTVLLRWIGGLSPHEAAAALGVDLATVQHDLRVAARLLRDATEGG